MNRNPNQQQAIMKQLLSTAFKPITSSIMMVIMIFMFGSNIQAFTVMIYISMISNIISFIANVNKTFERFTTVDKGVIRTYKILYLLCCGALVLFVVYKFSNLGIIPNRPSDYLTSLSPRIPIQEIII